MFITNVTNIIKYIFLFYQNTISGFEDIVYVWTNDAHKLASFVFIIYFPVFVFLFFPVFFSRIHLKFLIRENFKMFLKSIIVELIFVLIFIITILGIIGFGDLILSPFLDTILRSIGVIFYIIFSIFLYVFTHLRKQKNDGNNMSGSDIGDNNIMDDRDDFYSLVRYPVFSFMFFISLGFSLLSLNIYALLITIFVLLPVIILRVKREEDEKIIKNTFYIDYQHSVPMLVPNIFIFIKKYVIDKIVRDD